MAAIHQIVSLGLGTPVGVPQQLLFGLAPLVVRTINLCDTSMESLMPRRTMESVMPRRTMQAFCANEEP